MTVVVGTAGHIDHGKTTLLRALTGIDADRLPEERRRGMTIDVGYAHFRLPDGEELDFVDVPGHDRLVGNMLVGAGEIDAVLLVVAADDGPRAQTLEHLELLDALGLDIGLVAVTKTDAVEPARVAEVVADVRALLARTRLAGSEIVPVSSVSGVGLDELRSGLVALRDRAETAGAAATSASGAPRLSIDRVFAVRGRGTVVTGSLRGGSIARGRSLDLLPGAQTVRVRELQVHDAPVESGDGGGRIALNLAGDLEPPPHRGDVLTADPRVRSTADLIVVLHAPAGLAPSATTTPTWPPVAGSAFRLHLGTSSVEGRIRRGKRDTVALPDGRLVVRMRLERPIAAAVGDRFVLRRPSPVATLAGGVVLDVQPPIGVSARRVSPERVTALVEAGSDGPAHDLARRDLHGLLDDLADDVAATLDAAAMSAVESRRGGVSSAELRPSLARSLRRLVTADDQAAIATIDRLLDRLVEQGRLGRTGDRLHVPGDDPVAPPDSAVAASMDRLVRSLAVATPPALSDAARQAGCPPDAVRRLEADGRIVRLADELAYAAATFTDLTATAIALASAAPLSPSAFRDATGTSRRYVMAILEDLDRRGVLRRTPDGHVPGPRAPR